ncbi:MAG: peroxiredoxin [Robiginitomaculum sp.]|nr:MAG: peroxiredoxin [Robiginitomaculum sp.]
MTIKIGDSLPDVTFMSAGPDGPMPLATTDVFAGKRVALFSVPGAFTPTCSAQHLPGYKQHASSLRDKGIEAIACVSVNDVFVMDAWGKDQEVGSDVQMLADGNGSFADAIGLSFDGSGFGMGKRAQRYSMVVNDGVVEQLNVEEPGEFKISSAEYMLGAL